MNPRERIEPLQKERKSFSWTEFALRKPVTIWIIMILGVVFGFFSAKNLPLEMVPVFQGPYFRVYIPVMDSSPPEIEQQITLPVEEELKTLKGLETIRTWSTTRSCFVFLEFSWELNPKLAYLELRDRLERVRPELPDQVEDFYIWQYSSEDWPVLWMAFSGPIESVRLFSLARQHVEPALKRIDGVANVEIYGIRDERLLVEADMAALAAHNVDILRLLDALQKNNMDLSIGTLEEAGRKYLVRAVGHFSDPAEVAALPLRGSDVKVGDVAAVTLGLPPSDYINRVNGRDAVTMAVYKESLANTVDVCARIREALDSISDVPEMRHVDQSLFFDQSKWIVDSLSGLLNAGKWGGLFAIVILLLFLKRLRPTGVITVAIPMSILVTLAVMFFVNNAFSFLSLNMVSMMGMMLAIGMLVDNSIVVMENIFRLREEGRGVKEAAVEGAVGVSRAVTAATLTTVVVFLPMIFVEEGELRIYLREIGLVIVFSLLASLWIALTFIPLTAAGIMSRIRPVEHALISRIGDRYRRLLRYLLGRKFYAGIIILLVFSSISFPSKKIEMSDKPRTDSREVHVRLRIPDSFTLDETDDLIRKVENILQAKREEFEIKSIYSSFSATRASIEVYLLDPEKDSRFTWEISKEIKEILPQVAGVEFLVDYRSLDSGSDEISICFYGDDSARIREFAEIARRRLVLVEGVDDIELKRTDTEEEITIRVKRELTTRYGLTAGMVSRAVAAAVSGIPLRRFRHGAEEVPSRLRLQPEDRQNLEQLKNLPLSTPAGVSVPLGTLTEWSFGTEPSQIERQDGKTVSVMSLKTFDTDLGLLKKRIELTLDGLNYPPGYGWLQGERFERMEVREQGFSQTMLLAAILVFILIGALFESWIHPFIIILTVPFALLGVYWMLFLLGTPMDIMATIGMIILVGIVVNNSIVLLDHVNTLRRSGLKTQEAIIEGARDRMRPILMTAGTTILGMLPMAVGQGGMAGSMYQSLGRVVIGGLAAATFGTLFVLPLIYAGIEEARLWFRSLLNAVTGRR